MSLFVDLTKAFHTVDHEILLAKMAHYGIRGHANNFFRSYLTNRSQYTVVGNNSSEIRNISCGVPQGSVLGPLLFLIYVNDLPRCLNRSLVRLFADDTGLHMYDTNFKNLIDTAKLEIQHFFDWCICNNLTINYDKTSFILFHSRNKKIPVDFNNITVNNIHISRVASAKYLGIYFDECLSWKFHVNHVCKSLLKFFGIFNHIKHFITKDIARQLYFAFIYSRISYGLEVYGNCSKNLIEKIQRIQNKLLKILTLQHFRTPTNEVHSSLNILKVKDIQSVNIICFVRNCLLKKCPENFYSYYQYRNTPYPNRSRRLNIQRTKSLLGSLSIQILGAQKWNELPEDLKDKQVQLNFRKLLSKHFLNEYN